MKKQFCLAVILSAFFFGALAQPSFPASTPPARNSTDVISLFSEAYTDVAGTNWFPNWSQTTVVSDITILGNSIKKYTSLNYQGVQLNSSVNVSSMTYLHFDIWTADCTAFDVYLINTSPGLLERKVTVNPALSGWVSYDILLTQYSPVALNNIQQLKLQGTPASACSVYLDNIYFWKSASSPVISGFNVPAKLLGDAPFTLANPTSNSNGAFTYTSGNTAVATISGNVVTLIGVGTSVITANQAAAGIYTSGSVTANLVVSNPPPPTPAPTPTVPAADVISLFSNAYTNVTVDTWSASWDNANFEDITISGNDTKKYFDLNYAGIEFTSATIDATSMQNYHVDIWTSDASTFSIKLVDFGADGIYGGPGSDDTEQQLDFNPALSGWVSYDIPLSEFSGLTSRAHLAQMLFISSNSTVYVDNIYFWKSPNAPTITGFSVPAHFVGDAPFTITPPTSNSLGAFSYSSSNPAVATVSGNTITIIGVGSAIITATQVALGAYGSGSASASLVVTYRPPTTAAPTPTKPAANVISLYSNAYTNVPVDTWSASWDNADLSETTIAGNDTKKYANLIVSGTEFTTTTVNATSMEYFHVDIWTPDATAFNIKLVDFGADGAYLGGDDSEQELSYTPAVNGWVSYDIPFTDFTGLTSRAHLAQLLFVSSNSTVYVDNVYFWKTGGTAPVTLINFTAAKTGKTTDLKWIVANEFNNNGFAVERSIDGNNWSEIQFVNSKGNTNIQRTYVAVDKAPVAGTNFYRLKQVDNDGRKTYSSIVSVKFTDKEILNYTFYPNPAKDYINLVVNRINTDYAKVQLLDVQGKVVREVMIKKSDAGLSMTINTKGIAKGIYILKYADGIYLNSAQIIID